MSEIYSQKEPLRLFAETYYPDYEEVLEERRLALIERAHRSKEEYGLDLNDPFSCDSCKLACCVLPKEVYHRHQITRNGGVIFLRNSEVEGFGNHAFLSSADNPDRVLDFVAGQFARLLHTSLDQWIRLYPELFINRALCSDKQTIERKLGIIYPKNIPFEQFFGFSLLD